jgi:uncharacterized protein YqjF (DUF2071 family)
VSWPTDETGLFICEHISVNTEITDSIVASSKRFAPSWLQRHPLEISAFFRHSLVLTYALPPRVLEPLLPPGLILDTYNGCGFVAIAMVQTEWLRPSYCPKLLGQKFFLSGYRIFTRYKTKAGRTLRGLRILRSDTDRRVMVRVGNCLTHYNYHLADVRVQDSNQRLEIQVRTPNREADLHVIADLTTRPATPPSTSPFRDLREARLFAGPLPFTFDYEASTHSIIIIEGVRREWKPVPVNVEVLKCTFFHQPAFQGAEPILANTFDVENIPYRWKRGVLEPLTEP